VKTYLLREKETREKGERSLDAEGLVSSVKLMIKGLCVKYDSVLVSKRGHMQSQKI
jgi:hypothetical protein